MSPGPPLLTSAKGHYRVRRGNDADARKLRTLLLEIAYAL